MTRTLIQSLAMLAMTLGLASACGEARDTPRNEGEHALSAQQEALERSKAAAAAMEDAAAQREERSAPQ